MQQIPITLKESLFHIAKLGTLGGVQCALEAESFEQDFQNSKKGGFFDLSDWGIVQISGPDAAAYLQRMSTVNVSLLKVGDAVPGAFLTGKGTLVAWGDLFKLEESSFLFVTSPGQKLSVMEHLELFHFQENLEIKDQNHKWVLMGWWHAPFTIDELHWRDFARKELQFVLIPQEKAAEQLKRWKESKLAFLGMQLFHYFRITRGIPWMGWEANPNDLVLEASLEAAVARNKGCYPGQEVVERIFTYGQVNRKLLRVQLEKSIQGSWPATPLDLKMGEEAAGKLVSLVESPEDPQKAVGLAMIRKSFWGAAENFKTNSELKCKLVEPKITHDEKNI